MALSEKHTLTVRELRARIPEGLFWFDFTRSSGPGGQNVNKVSTRVTLRFNLAGCEALTRSQKQRITARLRGRVSRDGILRVVAARYRTQQANRRAVIERFYELLAWALYRPPRRKRTTIPKSARERRLKDKRIKKDHKRLRSPVTTDRDE